MQRWLKAVLRFFVGGRAAWPSVSRHPRPAPTRQAAAGPRRRSYPLLGLKEHAGDGRPARLHWKASHPSTMRRFKAEVTCSRGHGITLRNHTIEADGRVVPSIVCRTPDCDFHEIVRLEGWRSGRIPAGPGAV